MPTPPTGKTDPSGRPVPSRFRRLWSRRVAVRDESMLPTLRPGDRLLVDRRAYRDRLPQAGEVVILVDPEEATRWLVKRVAAVDRSGRSVEVRGDSADTARDSRRFGPVPIASLVGRVYRCYFPTDRRRDF